MVNIYKELLFGEDLDPLVGMSHLSPSILPAAAGRIVLTRTSNLIQQTLRSFCALGPALGAEIQWGLRLTQSQPSELMV